MREKPTGFRLALQLRKRSDVGWDIALRGSLNSFPERFAKRTLFQSMKQRPHERSEQGSGNPRRDDAPARGADGSSGAWAPAGADGRFSPFVHRRDKTSCKEKRVTLSYLADIKSNAWITFLERWRLKTRRVRRACGFAIGAGAKGKGAIGKENALPKS